MKMTKKPLKKHAVPPGQTNASTKTYDQLTDAQKQATNKYVTTQELNRIGVTDPGDRKKYINKGMPQSKKGGSVSAKMKSKSKSKKK